MCDSPAQFEVGWIPGIFEMNNETMNAQIDLSPSQAPPACQPVRACLLLSYPENDLKYSDYFWIFWFFVFSLHARAAKCAQVQRETIKTESIFQRRSSKAGNAMLSHTHAHSHTHMLGSTFQVLDAVKLSAPRQP